MILAFSSSKLRGTPWSKTFIVEPPDALLLKETDVFSGVKNSPEYPKAQRILPQFASFPKKAAFTKLDDITDFASFLAV